MTMKKLQLSVFIVLIAAACGQPQADSKTPTEPAKTEKPEDTPTRKYVEVGGELKKAQATLTGCSDSEMKGEVYFSESKGQVKLDAKMENVPQGEHGFHIHAIGDCSGADGKTAGGHWNPMGVEHGKWGEPPFHKGDIGNFITDKNGMGSISLKTDLWCIGCGDETKDIIGKSIIVHAGKDDCTSQPSGAAGPRIACGVIENS